MGAAAGSALSGIFWLDNAVAAIPASEGYLLVDTRKCQGCVTCMLSCSLVHEGKENLSLARIQVVQNPFADFPHDIALSQCRQCVDAPCVEACLFDALEADPEHGYVRRISEEKCVGCGACVEECPYTPSRPVRNPDDLHDDGAPKSTKCDLCVDTPFWNETGGPGGKQVCVELCPVGALKFTKEIPEQEGDAGYDVNLRGEGWKKLHFSDEPEKLHSEKTGVVFLPWPHTAKWETRTDLDGRKSDTGEAQS